MNEAKVRQEVGHMLTSFGFDVKHYEDAIVCPRCKHLIIPERGRPDLVAMHPQRQGLYVEVKVFPRGKTAFPFSNISPEQREFLGDWSDRGGLAYLGLGTVEGRPDRREKPRRAWLIPWHVWLMVEEVLTPIQASLPLYAERAKFTAIREGDMDAVNLLAGWELSWKSGGWHPQTDYQFVFQGGHYDAT